MALGRISVVYIGRVVGNNAVPDNKHRAVGRADAAADIAGIGAGAVAVNKAVCYFNSCAEAGRVYPAALILGVFFLAMVNGGVAGNGRRIIRVGRDDFKGRPPVQVLRQP